MTDALDPSGPAVVALGGGHGLAVALRAARLYASSITAVVSIADDGGSSGRLRRDLGVAPPGDVRRCLVALAGEESVWTRAFEHRFADGELAGHALGNLVLVGLAETSGNFEAALAEAGRLLQTVGQVLPATTEPVVLKADVVDGHGTSGASIEGQAAVSESDGIQRVELVPDGVTSPRAVLDAIAHADQVLVAPGSLYTSVLPVLCVADIGAAVRATQSRVIQIGNLRPQIPETAGLDGTDHLDAVLAHDGRVDLFVYQQHGSLTVDPDRVRARGVAAVAAQVARADGLAHDPVALAATLRSLR